MVIFRALWHAAAAGYYRWALNAMHPAHQDASYVTLQYALHLAALRAFLRTGEIPQ